MTSIRPLPMAACLGLALLACTLPARAGEGPRGCADPAPGEPRCLAPTIEPAPASTGAAPHESTGESALDCSHFALGGLVSGVDTLGIHASQVVSTTLRQCSRRGFVFGVALLAPRANGTRHA